MVFYFFYPVPSNENQETTNLVIQASLFQNIIWIESYSKLFFSGCLTCESEKKEMEQIDQSTA